MPVLLNALGKLPGAFSFLPLAAVLALAMLVAGCRPEPPADLTVINGPDPGSLDPLLVTGIEELRAVLPLFEGLTRPDPATGRALPGLAERWEISPDGRHYTFHLRTNAAWSTGGPITSADLVYSWRRILEPTNACQYVNLMYPLHGAEAYAAGQLKDFAQVGVRAPDAHTVEATLDNPCPWFLDLCAFQTLSVVPRAAIERDGDQWIMRHPPFSGAYELEYWRISDRVRLRRNERYWDAANTRSRIVDLLVMSSPATALNLYEDHQVDVILDKPLVPTELLPVLAKTPDYHTFPMLGSYFVRINVTRPPLNDPRVRRALALTVDKPRLTQRIAPTCEPADHIVPGATANYLRGEGQHRDPELARRLLAEAGFPGGKGFPKLSYLADSSGGGGGRMNERVAVELQDTWRRELGIEIEIRSLEKKVAIVAQRTLDYDLSRSSWIGDYNDPSTFLDLFTKANGNNRTGWSHPEYERLMRKAAGEADLGKRALMLRDAETLLVRDEAPIIPLWFESGFTLNSPTRVEGMFGNVLDVHPLNAIRRIPSPATK